MLRFSIWKAKNLIFIEKWKNQFYKYEKKDTISKIYLILNEGWNTPRQTVYKMFHKNKIAVQFQASKGIYTTLQKVNCNEKSIYIVTLKK